MGLTLGATRPAVGAPVVLPYPVTFVYRGLDRWRELLDTAALPDPDEIPHRFSGGVNSWTIQTYLRLKRRGHDVRLSGHFVPGQICVAHYDHAMIRQCTFRSFVVLVRADRPPAALGDLQLVQNASMARNGYAHFMPHWPQPGLIPRDASRGQRLETVAYMGQPYYLPEAFRAQRFAEELARVGIRWSVQQRWHDYSEVDAILAVRQATAAWAAVKPASKLVNAWRAGCIPLLGPEPAYRELRQSDLDYMEVNTPGEAIDALQRLQRRPELFQAMLEQGRRRTAEYTVEMAARRWEAFLAGPAAAAYERWLHQGGLLRPFCLAGRFAVRIVKHRVQRRRFWREVHKGDGESR